MKKLFLLCSFSLALALAAQSGPAEDLLRDWANISIFHLDQSNKRINAIENLKGKRWADKEIRGSMRGFLFSEFRSESPEDYTTLLLLDGEFEPHGEGLSHRKKIAWIRSDKQMEISGYGDVDLKVLRRIAAEQQKRKPNKSQQDKPR